MTLRLNGSTSGYTEIDAPAIAGSNTLTLPGGNGTNGQVLTTDGAGALSFTTVAGAGSLADGSAAAPSVAFASDVNTGIFRAGNDLLAFSTGGTERAQFDASGRLLIGTSTSTTTAGGQSPLQVVTVGGSNVIGVSAFNFSNGDDGGELVLGSSRGASAGSFTVVQNNDTLGRIRFAGADGTDLATPGAFITAKVDGTPGGDDLPCRLEFSTTADAASSPTERMRITQSGRFGFGNINPSYFADLKTASNARFVVHNSGTGLPMLGFADSGSNYQDGRIDAYSLNIVTGSGSLFGGSTVVRLANGATSWSSLSDERQKTSLTPIEDGLSKVAGLRAVTGRYLTDDPDKSRSFLIAQDVQAVLPEAVLVEDNEDQTLSLRYTEVIPLLVAALKESKERIETLEARLTALEVTP
jgi:hypothetical protein